MESRPIRDITTLRADCARLGIDISGIPTTEAVSTEEIYRLKVQALVLAQELENSELGSAAKDREIRQLTSRLEEGREISRTLSVAARNMEVALTEWGEGGAVADIAANIPRSPEVAEALSPNELARRRQTRTRQTEPMSSSYRRFVATLEGIHAAQLEGRRAEVGIPQVNNNARGPAVELPNGQPIRARGRRQPRTPQLASKSHADLHPRSRYNNL